MSLTLYLVCNLLLCLCPSALSLTLCLVCDLLLGLVLLPCLWPSALSVTFCLVSDHFPCLWPFAWYLAIYLVSNRLPGIQLHFKYIMAFCLIFGLLPVIWPSLSVDFWLISGLLRVKIGKTSFKKKIKKKKNPKILTFTKYNSKIFYWFFYVFSLTFSVLSQPFFLSWHLHKTRHGGWLPVSSLQSDFSWLHEVP